MDGRWGANGDLGKSLVCLSLRPSWGMLKHRYSEVPVAALVFRLRDVLALPDVRPCPVNSGSAAARPYLDEGSDRVRALGNCLLRPEEKWSETEILVAGPVPLSLLQQVVLPVEALATLCSKAFGVPLAVAAPGVTASSADADSLFPGDYLRRQRRAWGKSATGVDAFRDADTDLPVRVRVYEVAQVAGLRSAHVVSQLQSAGLDVRSASSQVDGEWAMHILSPRRHPKPSRKDPREA